MTGEQTIIVDQDGLIKFIWDDSLAPVLELGAPIITRASHVEPDAQGQWIADLSPIGGPSLGPFRLRGEALTAEREHIEHTMRK